MDLGNEERPHRAAHRLESRRGIGCKPTVFDIESAWAMVELPIGAARYSGFQ